MDSSCSKRCWSPLQDKFAHEGLLEDSDFQNTLAGRRTLHLTAVPSIFSWKKDSPKKRKPLKCRYVVSKEGPEVSNEELEVKSTSLNVDKVADEKPKVNKLTCNTSLNVDKAYEVLEVDCTFQESRTSQEESTSELKRQVVELINKLEGENKCPGDRTE